MSESKMLAAALAYVGRGWPVFPCEPGEKAPLGVCVPRGFKDATLDVEHVRRWWTRYPAANVAIPTGAATFDVLDVDVEPSGTGYPAFNQLKRAGLIPEPLAIVATPRGGMHGYFAGSDQACGRLKAHHIDFKASGGYVLAPPSEVNGRPYSFVHEGSAAGMLNWSAVKDLLAPPRTSPVRTFGRPRPEGAGIPGLAAWLAAQAEGNRNSSLFWACCRALENGAAESDLDELVTVAQSIGLDQREALRTVRSALRTTRRSA
ncbi:hypothetical protein FHU36_008454 [Nonomuraea muscovyensis]|uniref:DNA primase n=1 Tax=Nonomuraea muscovyensis TaxID=1124761 RepID=A0A7X0CCZ2_9ACTN|nr:bifunctional DNA primase/polymerase [Nonomuraea muscovyensis]MBB6351871.1 hypothetical protein [Nonomuraea muscovyensis]